MKPSGIGGMAVIEGVMMKNKEEYAVAVRKPNNEIVVEKNTYKDFADKVKLFKLPIFRGMLAFVDSLIIGIKVLNFSSSFFEDEEEQGIKDKKDKKHTKADKKKKKGENPAAEELSAAENSNQTDKEAGTDESTEKSNAVLMAAAVVVSLILSVSLFMVLPVLVSSLFAKIITSRFLLSLLEGLLRLAIFIGYILAASRMKEIKRVFMYHGAEHKTINCLENGFELTVENVRWQSKQHKRCGTSFMLLVMVISLIFFIILQPHTLLWRILSRVLLVPFIAGVSYEFIRLAGRSRSRIVNVISQPGLWLQALTTKEPDDSMIEVAIQSVDAVFDWRGFLETAAADQTKAAKTHGSKKKAEHKPEGKTPEKTSGKTDAEPEVKKVAEAKSDSVDKYKKTDRPVMDGQTKKYTQPIQRDHARPMEIKFKETAVAPDDDDEILKALDKYLDFGDKNSTSK